MSLLSFLFFFFNHLPLIVWNESTFVIIFANKFQNFDRKQELNTRNRMGHCHVNYFATFGSRLLALHAAENTCHR